MDSSSEPMRASSLGTSPVIKCEDTGTSVPEDPTGVVVVVVAATVATVLEGGVIAVGAVTAAEAAVSAVPLSHHSFIWVPNTCRLNFAGTGA